MSKAQGASARQGGLGTTAYSPLAGSSTFGVASGNASTTTTAAIAASLSANTGLQAIPTVPNPEGLTNVATWHLSPDEAVSIAWWKVEAPSRVKDGDFAGRTQIERFENVVKLLRILRYSEACLLALEGRLENSRENNVQKSESTAAVSQCQEAQDTAKANSDDFAKEVLSSRVLFATDSSVAPEDGGAQRPSKYAVAPGKRRKLSQGQGVEIDKRVLWLFKAGFRNNTPGAQDDDTEDAAFCNKALAVANRLLSSVTDLKSSREDVFHAKALIKARSALQVELPFIMIEMSSPHGYVELARLRTKPAISKAFSDATGGALTAWALYKRDLFRPTKQPTVSSSHTFIYEDTLMRAPSQSQKSLRSRPPFTTIRLSPFVSSRVLQLQFNSDVDPRRTFRHMSDKDSSMEGREIVLVPTATRARFSELWSPASMDRVRKATDQSDEGTWLRLKEQLQEYLLASGCMGSSQIFHDFREDRFVLCRSAEKGASEHLMLWPQSLCLVVEERPSRLTTETESKAKLFQTSDSLKDALENARITIDQLMELRSRGKDVSKQLDEPSPALLPSIATPTPLAATRNDSRSMDRELATDQNPLKSSPDLGDDGDADLWGEEEEEQEAEQTQDRGESSSDGIEKAVAEKAPDASAVLTSLFDEGMQETGEAFTSGPAPNGRSASTNFEGMDLVTDDDFDFFGGGVDGGDIDFGAAMVGPSIPLNPVSSSQRDDTSMTQDVSMEKQAINAATNASLESNFSSIMEPPSLTGFTPSSVASSSAGPLIRTPRTPADEHLPEPDPLDQTIIAGDGQTDQGVLFNREHAHMASFHALPSMETKTGMISREFIGSKYEAGKFAMPQEQTQPVLKEEVGHPKERMADRPGPLKRRSFRNDLPSHDFDQDERSDAASDRQVESETSGASDSDSDSDLDAHSGSDELVVLSTQIEHLRSSINWLIGSNDARDPGRSNHTGGQHARHRQRWLDVDVEAAGRRFLESCTRNSPSNESSWNLIASHVKDTSPAPDDHSRAKSLLQGATLHVHEQTNLLVSSRGSVIRIGSAALGFWDRLNLGPLGGRKDVMSFFLGQDAREGVRSDAVSLLNSWKVTYEKMSLGTFHVAEDPFYIMNEVSRQGDKTLLETLRANEDIWNDTVMSLVSRLVEGAGSHHVILWISPEIISSEDWRSMLDLEAILNEAFVKRDAPSPAVTIKRLAPVRPIPLECINLYDEIPRRRPHTTTRQIHPESNARSDLAFYPAIALASPRSRMTGQFALAWPKTLESHNALESIVHVSYVLGEGDIVQVSMIDGQALDWDIQIFRVEGTVQSKLHQVYAKVLQFCAGIAEKVVVAICTYVVPSAEELDVWRSMFVNPAIKSSLLRGLMLAALQPDAGIQLHMSVNQAAEGNRAALAGPLKSSFQDVSLLRQSYIFGGGQLAHPFHTLEPLGSALLLSSAPFPAPTCASPSSSKLHLICASFDQSLLDGVNARDWLATLVQSHQDLSVMTRVRTNIASSLPWHVAAMALMEDRLV